MRFDDPELVAREYASGERLAARKRAHTELREGVDTEEVILDALREALPARVLELWRALGDESPARELEFSRENGDAPLRRHFAEVECREAPGNVVFSTQESIREYVAATIRGAHLASRAGALEAPFRTRSTQAVFVADKAP